MKKQITLLLALGLLLLHGCQKEIDFDNSGGTSEGTLKSTAGDCLPKTVNGIYKVGTTLIAGAHTIMVDVDVTKAGAYTITSDTINGYSFKAVGTFANTGINTVTLQGTGTPIAVADNNFTIKYGTSTCKVMVTVIPAGNPAVFSLAGAPGNCTGATPTGTYAVGVPLNASHTVPITVNVTVVGTYNITATYQGMTFALAGTFTSTGSQVINLVGTGIPTTGGTNVVPLTAGTTTCNFTVNVGNTAAVGSLGGQPGACTPFTPSGTYTAGTVLTGSNTVQVQVNVTTAGAYSISTNMVNGFSFAGSGTFAGTGLQPVTLTGIGTPTSGGPTNFTATFGTSACTFSINVGTSGAVGSLGGQPGACTPFTPAGTYTVGTILTGSNTVALQVNVTTPGSYSITTNTVTGFSFSATGTFATTGTLPVTLTGNGTPTTAGNQTFTATFGSSSCSFVINVAGTGAVGTLGGQPGACTPFTPAGTYTAGTVLTSGNTVQLSVNVTTAGSYSITTNTVSSFSFSASGTFAATGVQPVTLNGTGTPAAAGVHTFTATFGTSSCTFPITVVAPPPPDYFPRTTGSNWSYEFDDNSMDSLYRVVIPQTHNAMSNTYNIFMANDGTGLDSSGYYRKASSDYFEYLDFGGFIGYDGPSWGEYLMVKDNVPAGNNWKTPVTGFPGTYNGGTPINLRFSMTILQKDVAVSVTSSTGTANYTNVIVVEEKFEAEVSPGNWVDATGLVGGYGKSYYARGIGLIKFELLDTGGGVIALQELRRYQVN